MRDLRAKCSHFRSCCALFRRGGEGLALLQCGTFRDAGGTAPPSVLPDISPLGGRSAVVPASANFQHRSRSAAPKLPISPQVGEMAGRPEGGAKERQPSS
ncbi:MAG: hypothetical protein EOS86_25390 [Mesorhizobium sp.]|nr:MAG: hypothetical protein EOS86_25390 [Mesorhizobium sp.]